METLTHISVIGLTGGIGSGKSVISRILRCNGKFVYDCDYEANWLMTHDITLKNELISILGSQAYNDDSSLNRKFISGKLFSDPEIRKSINISVHSAVKEDILKKINSSINEFFIESAILATSGLDSLCDKIWLITAPEEIRIERIRARDSLTFSEIRSRIESQKEELALLPKSKIKEIKNDGKSPLLLKVLELTGFLNTLGFRWEPVYI